MPQKKSPQQVTRAYERAHPETRAKDQARAKVNNALRDGKIKKPTTCPNCGKKGGRIEYDHQGKPPGWKCSKCHPRGKGHKA
jgi:transposase-like protein